MHPEMSSIFYKQCQQALFKLRGFSKSIEKALQFSSGLRGRLKKSQFRANPDFE